MQKILEGAMLDRVTRVMHEDRLPAYLGEHRLLTSLNTGQSIVVDTENLDLTNTIIRYGLWEPWITRHLAKFVIRHGDPVIVDVGAHVGYYSIVLGGLTRSRRVWAFEPNRRLFEILKTNLFINGISQEGAHRIALASNPGRMMLRYKAGESGGGHIDHGEPPFGFMGEEIDVASLDSVLPDDVAVDLLKIDVEGYEPQVLHGAHRTITRSPNVMLCFEATPEAWKTHGFDATEIFWALSNRGFRLRLAIMEGLVELGPVEMVERISAMDYRSCVLASRDWSMMDARGPEQKSGAVLKRKTRSGLRRLRSAVRALT